MALKGKTVEKARLYEGIVTARVLAVNPSADDIQTLTGGVLSVPDSPAVKERDNDGDTFTQVRVRFLLKLEEANNPAIDKDVYTLADFYVSDRNNYQTSKGGFWVGTSAGQVGYVIPSDGSEESALKEVLQTDRKSFVTNVSSTVILKDGEKELFIFLSKLFNINARSEDVDVNYKELFFPDIVAGEVDWASLQEELDERQPQVRMLAYVDDRGYQKIDVRSTLNTVFAMTDVTYAKRLSDYIKRQNDAGYKAVNDAVNEVVTQREFDPNAAVADSGIESAEDALADVDV